MLLFVNVILIFVFECHFNGLHCWMEGVLMTSTLNTNWQ